MINNKTRIFLYTLFIFLITVISSVILSKFYPSKSNNHIDVCDLKRNFEQISKSNFFDVFIESIYPASLVRIIDGDTYEMKIILWEDIYITKRIRLYQADTNELSPKNGTKEEKEIEKEKAKRASEFVKSYFFGKQLRFKYFWSTDSFGRPLGTVLCYNEQEKIWEDIRDCLKNSDNLKSDFRKQE